MPIRAVEDRRLYKQIADQIAGLIASGEFTRGHRLPSERVLAAQLGVSRPSVREALVALQMEGLVEVQVGSGIFVIEPRIPAALPRRDEQGLVDLLRARWLVEGEIAALAAKKATEAEIAVLRESVEAEGPIVNRGEPDVEVEFHERLAGASRNGALVSVVRHLCEACRAAMSRPNHEPRGSGNGASWLDDHREIVAALEARDSAAARRAVRAHVERLSIAYASTWSGVQPRSTGLRNGKEEI